MKEKERKKSFGNPMISMKPKTDGKNIRKQSFGHMLMSKSQN